MAPLIVKKNYLLTITTYVALVCVAFLFSYRRVMYFTGLYAHGLMLHMLLSPPCVCHLCVLFKLWVICTVHAHE